MAHLQPRNQALGVPQSGRHDSKPEGGRLTANAITGLKPRRASYDVTDPGGASVQLRVMPSGTKRWYFRFYWRNKRQRLGLGLWPAVGLAEARARARKAREVLDEGIDPRMAGIVKRTTPRTESPVEHAPSSQAISTQSAIGTVVHIRYFSRARTISCGRRAICISPLSSRTAAWATSFTGACRRPSTIRLSSASIGTHSIQRLCSILGGDGNHHAPQCGQAVYVDASDRRGPVHTSSQLWRGPLQPDHEKIGTRYIAVAVRTLVDPADPKDVEAVHALQDAIKVDQSGGPGKFEVPPWDLVSQKKVREALLALASTLPDTKLIGAASAWGGNPERDALYLNVTPANNDGRTIYKINVRDVPVDGFWSISVYNAKGYFEPNPENAYSLNNITAKKD